MYKEGINVMSGLAKTSRPGPQFSASTALNPPGPVRPARLGGSGPPSAEISWHSTILSVPFYVI